VVEVLVIPDGAAQPIRDTEPTALQRAWTPVLDRLAAEGAVHRLATTPAGLAPGSEVGIPTLLGCPPQAQIGRGRIEAAAYGIEVPEGLVPWRADVTYPDGRRATVRQAREVAERLGCAAHSVGGHRLLLLCASRPANRRMLGLRLRVWDDGPPPAGRLRARTTLVCAPGAAAGCGRLLGAEVVCPTGATGDVDTDLQGKANAAAAAVQRGEQRVVVHVGAPDEAAHRREQSGVVAALERLDFELLGPLRDLVELARGRLSVCPDHGTDPATGAHTADPVPALVWGEGVEPSGPRRLDERAVRDAEILDAAWLLDGGHARPAVCA
jgi:2,3-bisphosphoglycerate-independent phosphoglycerate mutase